MKKHLLALLLLATMIFNIFAMTGCFLLPGNQDDDKFEEGKINITFYHTMGANLREVLDNYIEEFEALYPFINVIHEQTGGYDDVRDQISTELMVGEHPNLAYCYPDHVALYNVAKAVTVLDNLIDYVGGDYTFTPEGGENATITAADIALTQAQKDDFITAYYEEGRQFGDGKMYTMPLSKSTEVLYYNKTFFTANNIDVPDHWVCDDSCGNDCTTSLEYVCKKIKEIDPTSIPLGYDSEANWFITMCEQLGLDTNPYTSATGEHFLFDDVDNYNFVKTFCDWYINGYVTTQEIYGAYTSGLFVASTGEKSYMSIGSSAGATHQRPAKVDGKYPFEVGIAPIPQANDDNQKVISQGPSLCIFEDMDPDKEMASWLFVKFLTTTVGFQAEFSMASGYVPVIKSVAQNEIYAAFINKADGGDNIAALSAKVCLDQQDNYYTSPAFNGSSTARDQVGLLMQACFVDVAKAYDSNKNLTDAQKLEIISALFKKAVAECKYQTEQK